LERSGHRASRHNWALSAAVKIGTVDGRVDARRASQRTIKLISVRGRSLQDGIDEERLANGFRNLTEGHTIYPRVPAKGPVYLAVSARAFDGEL